MEHRGIEVTDAIFHRGYTALLSRNQVISNASSSLGGEKRDKFAGFSMKNVKKCAGIERELGWKGRAGVGRLVSIVRTQLAQ